MMTVLSAALLPVAILLEFVWRVRSVDEDGNLHPSLREQAIADRYRRAAAKQKARESKS